MDRNPCYEDGTDYESVQPPSIPEITVKLSERDLSEPNCSTSIKNEKDTNIRAKCIGLVVVLSLLTIAMVAAIALSVYAIVGSNQGMDDSLMQEIQELTLQLNKTKKESETEIAKLKDNFTRIKTGGILTTNNATMAQLNSLQSSENFLNSANEATTTQLNSLQSSVSSLNTANGATMTQLNSLQSSVNSLNTANGAITTQLNSLQSSTTTQLNSLQSLVSSLNTANGATTTQLNSLQSSTTTQLNSLQSLVSSLTTRVNSPVNLYQNCIQETQSCTITSGILFFTVCTTPSLPVNKSVSC